MKILNYIFFGFVMAILPGCSNSQKNNDSKAIVGIWQNTTSANAAIEFTQDREYYLRLNGERILTNDSIVEKYIYDPLSKGNNLLIYGDPKLNTTQARLLVLNPENIKISLVHQGTIISEAEFTKVKEE